ncbi:MAG: DNA polymerase III subunit alpha [Chloroflexi bacterium]|nr:DNA polymerase III subunit alpha [Chloroflexota bacterium]
MHLHLHTEYSLLDGFAQIKQVVNRAVDLNMEALAITDHGTMFGVIDFYRACKAAGIKPIIGVEAYLARRSMRDRDPVKDRTPYHLLLLAKNEAGYKNLLKIASASQLDGYYYRPRIDKEFLAAHAEGIVATSGCLAAEIPRMVEEGRDDEALQTIGWYQDVFGKDNFFLELQQHDISELERLNKWLLENRHHANVPLVATNDVHYVNQDDYDVHDTLLCIQTSSLKRESKTSRLAMTDPSYHLRSQHEMWQIFGDVAPEALYNTRLITEMCDIHELDGEGYHLPIFPVPERFDNPEQYLRYLCERGIEWRYGSRASSKPIQDRLEHELNIIFKMGFATYFLIVWDLIEFARSADIWWNVRGSGAGSVVAYSLGITSLDPLENALIFERFLNPHRKTMPDFDLDFPEDRRQEMIEYCARKYGEDKVAAIITFGTLKPKAAIRDVGRALDLPLPEVNRIAKMVPTVARPPSIDQLLGKDESKPDAMNPEMVELYEKDRFARDVLNYAARVEGVPRHAGTHAAGIIVSDKPLVEYLPLHRPTGSSAEDAPVKQITQFPMETAESIGLLKIDFLGLSTLTIMRRACELIEQHHGIKYDMSNIPYQPDPENSDITRMVKEMFEMMGRGETIGVFQLESSGMRQMLLGMRPQTFEHIIAAISLFRPGPMQFIPQFNARLHGEETVEYRHPLLEPILQETYGICISGDSLILDTRTGQRYRVDQIAQVTNPIYVQGIDENYHPVASRVTHLIYNGDKPVFRVTLKNGATIKTTHDHRFLTETGWKPLSEIQPGDYVATPPQLIEPEEHQLFDRDKLRVLAYLIADGSLASGSSVDFVNKEQSLINEYVRCLKSFDDLKPVYTGQIHDVLRVGVRSARYKEVNSLLVWMRELGFKYPPGIRKHPCGVRSQEKSIPDFVFSLNNENMIYFLASLWDCDGYIGEESCHYKTISPQLAYDVQTLLLRLGISSTIYTSSYHARGEARTAYQVTTYDTMRLTEMLFPYMLTQKREVACMGHGRNTINRTIFIEEVRQKTDMSARQLMASYGIDRQHLYLNGLSRPRITADVVESIAEAMPLPRTEALINLRWVEIASIDPSGVEAVYDLTVEGNHHNFVANNIIVHNCAYQEQIMQIAMDLFGYDAGEADLMRRAVSKKKEKDLAKHRGIFLERGPQNGVDEEAAGKIFDDIEYFANYGFNKSHAADYAVITCQTAFLKCHYPHEYMTALMSIHKDDTDKISIFVADAKRMGIDILPPNINKSSSDFDIEADDNGQRHIRFGLGAIKNLGLGAVDYIIGERETSGPFKNLDDFLDRCSASDIGKRGLESAIKVGAFDEFGNRPTLLHNIDKLVKHSVERHKAAEVGQVSMFDILGGSGGDNSATSIVNVLEAPPNPADKREQLRWEKELVGMYVTDHPLEMIMDKLDKIITHNSHEIREAGAVLNSQSVIIAGLVTSIRTIITKNGDSMAILQVEDIGGKIECVMFPRIWGTFRDLVEEDRVLVIRGKAEDRQSEMQIIVDSVSQNFDVAYSEELEELRQSNFSWLPQNDSDPVNNRFFEDIPTYIDDGLDDDEDDDEAEEDDIIEDGDSVEIDDVEAPPETVAEAVVVPAAPVPEEMEDELVQDIEVIVTEEADYPVSPPKDELYEPVDDYESYTTEQPVNGHDSLVDAAGRLIAPPAPAAVPRKVTTRQQLVVTLYRSGDDERDYRLLRWIYSAAMAYPGGDELRVYAQFPGQEDRLTMDFPDLTILVCEALINKLKERLGENCVMIRNL